MLLAVVLCRLARSEDLQLHTKRSGMHLDPFWSGRVYRLQRVAHAAYSSAGGRLRWAVPVAALSCLQAVLPWVGRCSLACPSCQAETRCQKGHLHASTQHIKCSAALLTCRCLL